jgi:protein-L-isoaspartate(D-aspartate) O-methyltransferase
MQSGGRQTLMGRNPPFPWADEWPEITDPRVRAAFSRVPRARFVDPALRKWVERDAPLPIGEGQTISQPFVVAWMTEWLALSPGEKVLEIGTGSGFQTAILCEIVYDGVGRRGQTVYSIERHASLAEMAAFRLRSLGYEPHLRTGDGALGWPDAAPFDAIIVTAAPSHLPIPLWEQLVDGGRMVIPIGEQESEQTLWRLIKRGMTIYKQRIGPVRFVPMLSPILDDPTQRIDINDEDDA